MVGLKEKINDSSSENEHSEFGQIGLDKDICIEGKDLV